MSKQEAFDVLGTELGGLQPKETLIRLNKEPKLRNAAFQVYDRFQTQFLAICREGEETDLVSLEKDELIEACQKVLQYFEVYDVPVKEKNDYMARLTVSFDVPFYGDDNPERIPVNDIFPNNGEYIEYIGGWRVENVKVTRREAVEREVAP